MSKYTRLYKDKAFRENFLVLNFEYHTKRVIQYIKIKEYYAIFVNSRKLGVGKKSNDFQRGGHPGYVFFKKSSTLVLMNKRFIIV